MEAVKASPLDAACPDPGGSPADEGDGYFTGGDGGTIEEYAGAAARLNRVLALYQGK